MTKTTRARYTLELKEKTEAPSFRSRRAGFTGVLRRRKNSHAEPSDQVFFCNNVVGAFQPRHQSKRKDLFEHFDGGVSSPPLPGCPKNFYSDNRPSIMSRKAFSRVLCSSSSRVLSF
jgi:hypothetical protein